MAITMIPADRRVTWNPGVTGGIPTYSVDINVKDAPYSAYGDGSHDDTTAIQSAINACDTDKAVYIPTGTYKISSALSLPSHIAVRGDGPSLTKIKSYGSSADAFNIVTSTNPGTTTNVNSGYTKGSTEIVVADASGFDIGDYVVLDQTNNSSLVDVGDCSWCGFDNTGNRVLGQLIKITNKSGNTLTVDPALHYTFEAAYTPQIHLLANTPIEWAGIEDLYVEHSETGTSGYLIEMQGAVESWIKNVECYKGHSSPIRIRSGFRNEVRECYVHHGWHYTGGYSYGVRLFNHCGECLVIDNIFYHLRHSAVIDAGGSGNVIAYNYSTRMFDQDDLSTNWIMGDMICHGAHPLMNLWEGNQCAHLMPDYVHGSASHNTYFRNYPNRKSERNDGSATTGHRVCVDLQKYNYYMNVFGNVLGQSGDGGDYEAENDDISNNDEYVYKLGYTSDGDAGASGNDANVKTTMLRHGNWDPINNATVWDAGIEDHDLPDSYFLASKPSFFGNLPYPIIGPDVSPMTTDIPAKQRYDGNSYPYTSGSTVVLIFKS